MNTTISDKEYDAAIAAANKAAADPYVYVHKLIQPFEYEGNGRTWKMASQEPQGL